MSDGGEKQESAFRRAVDLLGLRRSVVAVLAVVLLVDLGERMGERFLPIYLYALGGGALSVGLLSGLDTLLSALYSFPGGYLSDRIGCKRALMLFNCVAIVGFLIVVLFPSWKAVIAGAVLFISWSAISAPAMLTLIARVLPQSKRTMGVSMHSLIRRVPRAVGPLLGGALIGVLGEQLGMRVAFSVAAVMATIALPVQHVLIKEERPACGLGAEKGPLTSHPVTLLRRMSKPLRSLLVSDILIRFCGHIPAAFVVIWSMKVIQHPVSAMQFGLLTSIEMVTAILVYIPVAYFADRSAKKPFILVSFLFFTLFPLVLLFAHSFWVLLPVFILRGMKEFGEPTRKALILDLAPEEQKASVFGAYYLIRDLIVSLASFGGAFLWMISPTVNLLSAFFFGILGTMWFAARGKDV